MTSYHLDDHNHQVPDKLPPALRETDYAALDGMPEFMAVQLGRFAYCPKCRTTMRASAFDAHNQTYHSDDRLSELLL